MLLIVAKRLTEYDSFALHNEEMINAIEKYKSKSREIIYKKKTNNTRYIHYTLHYFLFRCNDIENLKRSISYTIYFIHYIFYHFKLCMCTHMRVNAFNSKIINPIKILTTV